MPKVSPKEKRIKTIGIRVTMEEYADLRAVSLLTNRTVSATLYDWLKPCLEELHEHPEVQKTVQLGRPLVALPTEEEMELRELAAWLEKDRLAR